MGKILLKIENLKVKGDEKEILKGVNLQIKKGELKTLLGPNASGKSTLAQVVLGNPKYKITEGKIIFNDKDITNFSPEKIVKMGMALAWQSPPSIKGVKLSQLLERISRTQRKNKLALGQGKIKEAASLLPREINLDLSGGEKKVSELIQILTLNPQLVILDEIDSGLDLKKIEGFAKIIKKELLDKKVSVLFITHSGAILQFLKPDVTLVMVDGKIICREKKFKKILKTIKKYGYEKCRKCEPEKRK